MKKYLILFLFAGVIFSSCTKQLDITPPNAITGDEIKKLLASGDTTAVKEILGGMADALPAYFRFKGIKGVGVADDRSYTIQGLNVMRNLEGNDIVFGTKVTNAFGYDEYRCSDFISSASNKNFPYWNYGWNNITAANKLLAYLGKDIVGTNKMLENYKARALTLRAYSYDFLMENYQDAYILDGKNKLGMMLYDKFSPIQPYKARSSSTATYDFILKDAKEAVQLFTAAGTGITASTTDIDLAVANFVLARAALDAGQWNTVITACNVILSHYTKLMTQSMYVAKNVGGTTLADPAKFLADSNGFLNISINPEIILGWPKTQSLKAHDAWMNTFGYGPGGVGGLYERIDNRLLFESDPRDYRRDNFLTKAYGDYSYPPNGVKVWIPEYSNLKFANTIGVGDANSTAYTAGDVGDYYMRTSEVLLMKAEAEARLGQSAAAKNTLNILLAARTRKGATTLTCDNYASMSGMTALQMVELQSRIELWGEGGYEFYNNKRWNIPINRLSSTDHVAKITYPVSGMTLQIPEDEMDKNPLCVQNH